MEKSFLKETETNHAFLKIIEANKGIIYKVSRAYCKNEEDRKDLMQEIIIQLWSSLAKYNSQYQLSTWIYRIALNVSITMYRKNITRQNKTSQLTDSIIYFDESLVTEKENEITLLYQFIHQLKVLDKALMLLYLEQKSYKEIAEILDITETNVATKLGRIKQNIKQQFLAHNK